jgi:hypothetical protein
MYEQLFITVRWGNDTALCIKIAVVRQISLCCQLAVKKGGLRKWGRLDPFDSEIIPLRP